VNKEALVHWGVASKTNKQTNEKLQVGQPVTQGSSNPDSTRIYIRSVIDGDNVIGLK